MTIQSPLFFGENICLGPIDHEKDPEIETRWTNDPEYLRMIYPEPARPLSQAQIKKKYEAIEKAIQEERNQFYFTIRMRSDDHLIGFAQIFWIEWTHGAANIRLGIGEPQDRRHGYGSEILRLLLRFSFTELNLYRLTASVPEYNQAALRFFKKSGFIEEVRRRQALQRDGRRWDNLLLGILRQEWEAHLPEHSDIRQEDGV